MARLRQCGHGHRRLVHDGRRVDLAMIGHTYRTIDVPVEGGNLRVGVWDPSDAEDPDAAPTALLVHGVDVVAPGLAVRRRRRCPACGSSHPICAVAARSNAIEGPAGLRAHAADLAATLDFLGIQQTLVVGHSMGAFVSVVFAHLHPSGCRGSCSSTADCRSMCRAGLDPDTLVSLILGPTAARLSTAVRRPGGVPPVLARASGVPARLVTRAGAVPRVRPRG